MGQCRQGLLQVSTQGPSPFHLFATTMPTCGLPRWPRRKESTWQAGEAGSIPGLGRAPEEEMATCSGILAWRISWIEETGGLQSVGS